MAILLVATISGCRVFCETGEQAPELVGRSVDTFAHDRSGTCIAVVDGKQVWRRHADGQWSHVATASSTLQCVAALHGTIYAGGGDEPAVSRISPMGGIERLTGFDQTPGRETWFGNGPPLGVRSLVANERAIYAAVHVGGVPRSMDEGKSWLPTLPVLDDAHQVCVHPSQAGVVAVAAATGLSISRDRGEHWTVYAGAEGTTSLAVAALEEEVLFSLQDGPFAKQSQLWRWRIADSQLEQVCQGLPTWLVGKVDTHWLTAARGQAALVDGGGNLWWSKSGSSSWQKVAEMAHGVLGLLLL